MKEKLKFLIINTSDENFTGVSLFLKGRIFSKNSSEERGHIKNLMPLIRDILMENSCEVSDLNFISIVEGPGSWTGLRIGFATLKVLCLINNLKLIVINNFDIFLREFKNKNNSTEIAILIGSSNQNYYYRYLLSGTREKTDGISSLETLIIKYPNIEKIYFVKPDISFFVDEVLEKYEKNIFVQIDEVEPYYISTGDLKSNFVKAKL